MLTTQKQVRAAFWAEDIPNTSQRRIKPYSNEAPMYNTDTRCAFVDYIDHLCCNGETSEALANRVTL